MRNDDEMVVWSTDNFSEPLYKIRFPKVDWLVALSIDCDREHLAALFISSYDQAFVQYWDIERK